MKFYHCFDTILVIISYLSVVSDCLVKRNILNNRKTFKSDIDNHGTHKQKESVYEISNNVVPNIRKYSFYNLTYSNLIDNNFSDTKNLKSIDNGGPNNYAGRQLLQKKGQDSAPKQQTTSRIVISATNNFDKVKLTINKKKIELMESTDDENGEQTNESGYYIAVLDQHTGQHLLPTHHIEPHLVDDLIEEFLASIMAGRMIVIFSMGPVNHRLTDRNLVYLESLGSMFASSLGHGMTWLWVFVKGGRTLAEGITVSREKGVAPKSVTVDTSLITSNTRKAHCPNGPKTSEWRSRRYLCGHTDGMGELCECGELPRSGEENLPENISNSVIVVITSRERYLYRTLTALFAARGFSRNRIEFFSDGYNSFVAHLLNIYGFRLNIIETNTDEVLRSISLLYGQAISFVKEKYQDADSAIFIEDDVMVSPDFFFTAPLLSLDDTLYCISAHNDLSSVHTSSDTKNLLRTESYSNYGWYARMSYLTELEKLIMNSDVSFDWDMTAYINIRRNRECVIPEVSRSKHFGVSGVHRKQYSYQMVERFLSFNIDPNVRILEATVMRLVNSSYELHIQRMFSRAIFLNPKAETFCRSEWPESEDLKKIQNLQNKTQVNLYPPWLDDALPNLVKKENLTSESVLVLFFELHEGYKLDQRIFKTLEICLRIFCCESREPHREMYRIRMGAATLLLVGFPSSPYSLYKPKNISVVKDSNDLFIQNNINLSSLRRNLKFEKRNLEDIWSSVTKL